MKTTHVTQVAAFGKLIGFCNANGAMYKPVKESLTVTALNSLLTSAQQSLEAVKSFDAAFSRAAAFRREAFENLSPLITRIVNAAKTSGASAVTVAAVKRNSKKFRSAPKAEKQPLPPVMDSTTPDQHSARRSGQLAYIHLSEHFAGLIRELRSDSAYNPAEPDLKIVALEAKLDQLRQLNEAMTIVYIQLKTARDIRDQYLYAEHGIHGTSMDVKNYLKSVFGFRSDPFEQVKRISFTKRLK